MRKTTSLILLIAGFIELLTGVVLYIIPSGRVAYWANYKLLGLDKHQWGDLHITVSFLLVIAACIHLYFNWKAIVMYLKNKARQLVVFNLNFCIALIICVYVSVGTLWRLPPMNYALALGERFTEKGNIKYGEPPFGHAELASLDMFCRRTNIDPINAKKLLVAAGVRLEESTQTIGQIAARNDKTPRQIYALIKPAATKPAHGIAVRHQGSGQGFGRKKIRRVCATHDISVKDAVAALRKSGIDIDPDQTIKEAAAKNGKKPSELFQLIQAAAARK